VQAVLGLVLLYRAYVADKASDTEAAIAQANEALQLARSLGDGHLEADAVLLLGALYWTRGDMRAVETASRRGLELAEQRGDNRQRIMALGGLSLALLNQGHVEQSLALDEQTLALAEASGRRGVAAIIPSNLGASYSAYGDFHKARGFLNRALQMRSESQERLGIGIVLLHSGRLCLITGDVAGAQVNLEEALHLFSALGNAKYHAETLVHRALVFLARQAYEEAGQDASAARDLAAGADIGSAMTLAHLALARVWLAQGQLQPALEASLTALALARGLSDVQSTVAALAAQAQILAAQGSEAAARAVVQQMLPLPKQISFHPLTSAVEAYLAASQALAADDPPQAQALLRHVHQRLLAAAGTIDDPAACHRFLHDNPTHREILALMAALKAE
jgi:tetratricopeptide (TPR) repeat protein